MKTQYRIFALLLGLALAGQVGATSLDSLKTFLSEVKSAKAHFKQLVLDKKLTTVQEASGTMLFSRPGKFRWVYEKPYEQLIVGDGAKLWMYDVDLKQVTVKQMDRALGSSPAALLEAFKSSPRAVLLGTRSFWEGVDVPGDSLSVVMITKIPFEVPSDPLVAARSETFEDPFGEYQVPEAILKFRQGFGRLIRSASDRGVVAILDRRVLTKQYGRLFIESLPQCTTRRGPLNDLPRETARWLNI